MSTNDGIPPGTTIATIKIEFQTGRWATIAMPHDMTAAEVTHLQSELEDFVDTALTEVHDGAIRTEAADPKTAERKSWK